MKENQFVTLFGKNRLNENSVVMHFQCILNALIMHCVVLENIHTPTTEGIGNSKGEGGGSKTQEIPEGRGVVWSI